MRAIARRGGGYMSEQELTRNTCEWSSDSGCWESSCGQEFIINDEQTPTDCNMRFCCFCGHELVQAKEVKP